MIEMPGVQHLQTVVGVCWLVELEFASGSVWLTSAPVDVTSAGRVWRGLGDLLDVQSVSESADAGTEQLELTLSLVNTAMLALVLGGVEGYRGRRVRLSLQLLDETFQPVEQPVLRWSGFMEPVKVSRNTPSDVRDGEPTGEIVMACTRAGMSRARNVQGARLTDAQQRAAHPGDTGLRYVRGLVEKPAVWLSTRFQAQ